MQLLARGDHLAQAVRATSDAHRVFGDHLERHVGEEDPVDGVVLDEVEQPVRVAADVVVHEDERAAAAPGAEHLLEGDVEAQRGELRGAPARFGGGRAALPADQRRERAVGHGHALRPPGGSRGVHDVGGVVGVRRQRRLRLARGDRGGQLLDTDGGRPGRAVAGPPGEDGRRPAVAEEERQAVLGKRGVERYAGPARVQHAEHGHQGVDGPFETDADALPGEPAGAERPGQPRGRGGQFRIGHAALAVDDGDGVRQRPGGPGDELVGRRPVLRRVGAAAQRFRHERPLVRGHDLQVVQPPVAVAGRVGQQGDEALADAPCARRIEDAGRVLQQSQIAVVPRYQVQEHVELGRAGMGVQPLGGRAGQAQAGRTGVLDGQHDLEEGEPGRGPLRGEFARQVTVRYAGVRHGASRGPARFGHQLPERLVAAGALTQGHDIGETGDERLHLQPVAPGDGRAQDDVLLAAEPDEQGRQGRGEENERRRAQLSAALPHRGGQLRADDEPVQPAAVVGLRGPRTVQRERRLLGGPFERAPPVLHGVVQRGVRRLALGPGVRAEGQGKGRQAGLAAVEGRPVQQAEFLVEQPQGPPVDDRVVHGHREHGITRAEAEQGGSQQRRPVQGQWPRDGGAHLLGQALLGHVPDGQRDAYGRAHDLYGPAVLHDECGAQRLVTGDDGGERGLDGRGVQLAPDPVDPGLAVAARALRELVVEPDRLLLEGHGAGGGGTLGHRSPSVWS